MVTRDKEARERFSLIADTIWSSAGMKPECQRERERERVTNGQTDRALPIYNSFIYLVVCSWLFPCTGNYAIHQKFALSAHVNMTLSGQKTSTYIYIYIYICIYIAELKLVYASVHVRACLCLEVSDRGGEVAWVCIDFSSTSSSA